MFFNQLELIVLFVGAIAYIVIFVILVLNRGISELIIRYLVAYILISFILDLLRTFLQYNLFDLDLQNIINIFLIIGLVGLSVLLLKICSLLLPLHTNNTIWLIAGTLWTIGLIFLIIINSEQLTNLLSNDFSLLSAPLIINGLAVFGWASMMSRIVFLSFSSHRVVNRPLHKNRLNYWTLSLLLIVIGDVLFFRNVVVVGSPLHLVGISVIVYIVITHNLVDILRTSLQSLRYLIITFFAVLVYALLFLVLQPIIQERPGYNALLGALFMAAILAFFINPIVDLVSKRINKSLLGMDYDPSSVMREYSHTINNIVDLKLLEELSIKLIKNTFSVGVGHLYVVEEIHNGSISKFQINDVCETDRDDVDRFELKSDDPIAQHFTENKYPLTQYDLDYHPIYRNRELLGMQKFLSQDLDVYVPIHQDNRWIGLFALGPKISGFRYYDEELLLMETLADQSAVALENAKLFKRLQQINKELIQAREELEGVNTRLLEMDQLKSAFISVITHEMRTPLANLGFALQIFEMYGLDNFTNEQKDQLEELNHGLVSARKMVDDLVTFAAFLNDQAELVVEEIDLREIVINALFPHQAIAKEKGVELKLDVNGKDFNILGDSKLLTNASYHLINNAVKFTQDGGSVIVSCWVTDNGLICNVGDTGIGISNERMANIWDAFASTSNPLQRGWEGLGLGLALVKLIVEAHGGRVWARSKLGKGSDFGFLVPRSMRIERGVSKETAFNNN